MFELKRLHKDAVPAALAKAERYRLLNEAREAESICRDVLAAEPGNAAATILLILALTDQFIHRLAETWAEATALVGTLQDPHTHAYYDGICHERRAKALLKSGRAGARQGAYADFRYAMARFEEAAATAPAGDDSALLRWNTCARILNASPEIKPDTESGVPSMLE
ncbi:MAG TPA: hypothetical protein VFV19_08945 [Candidatus Polarisedimenticolaceae bacterium]|nr:hypothetical protein [Candidatus Polarisedimenticolaceae bacterium]